MKEETYRIIVQHLRVAVCLAGLAVSRPDAQAAPLPPPDQLLPEETIFFAAAPDLARLREIYTQMPQSRLWNDPGMKPFRDNFSEKWREEFLVPLERELRIPVRELGPLFTGQVTLALIDNSADPATAHPRSALLMMGDTGTNAATVAEHLAEARKKWSAAGQALRVEKIREREFMVLPGSALPSSLRPFLPRAMDFQELGATPGATPPGADPLLVSLVDSVLVVTDSRRVAERLLIRLSGGPLPVVAGLSAYQSNHQSHFRDVPFYAWVNVRRLTTVISRANPTPEKPPPSPVDVIRPEKLLQSAGFGAVDSAAFTFRHSVEGEAVNLFFSVPEGNRQGLVAALSGLGTDADPPPFVPVDTVRYQRWRLDGKKTWASFERMMADVSPQWIGAIRFILDTANDAAKLKDADFDINRNLLGNLGDDLIRIEKAPRGTSPAQMQSPPSLILLGSPEPVRLTAALKSVLIFMSPQAETPAEREFLGRKILSVPLPYVPLPVGGVGPPAEPRTLHYAAGASYVAMSTDASLVEEYLRSADNGIKPLRDLPGLPEAAQRVTGPGLALFGIHRRQETMAAELAAIRVNPSTAANPLPFSTLPGVLGLADPEKSLRPWMDPSLLPAFENISKYFHYTVYGLSTTTEGISFKWFAPTPPALRSPEAPRH